MVSQKLIYMVSQTFSSAAITLMYHNVKILSLQIISLFCNKNQDFFVENMWSEFSHFEVPPVEDVNSVSADPANMARLRLNPTKC